MSKIESGNKDIKFPSHHYVGFQSRPSVDNVPLGFMTPDGTDAAAKKRKESVDRWAEPHHYHGQPKKEAVPSVTYENKPMVGFKLSREIRRTASFGNGTVKWRIEDPRGFELEISSPNFAQILMLCTMECGEIQEQLIWGRLGSENVLVPVNSDAYRAAQANTARVAKKASLRDLSIGDTAILHNGDQGVYMGALFFTKVGTSVEEFGVRAGDKKRHVFLINDTYQGIASPKISEIIQGESSWTIEESCDRINAALSEGARRTVRDNSNDYHLKIVAVSVNPVTSGDIRMIGREVSLDPCLGGKELAFFTYHTGIAAAYMDTVADARVRVTSRTHSWGHEGSLWVYPVDPVQYASGKIEAIQSTRYGYSSRSQDHVSVTHVPSKGTVYAYEVDVNGKTIHLPMTRSY